MLSDNNENKVWVHLYGGEQDGFRRRIDFDGYPPKRFLIWHIDESPFVETAADEQRELLVEKLATLAYEYVDDVEVLGERELRYRRAELADKTAS
ncbi:hypothetical protein Mycsm_01269 [Mycobacterium sp. JS623]|uniref:hypothetical protein n=1 Tax=Mycobacterium sp. JS623 TaxID=212767 RepID=UPI0002A55EDD|nr:hypothetical protein [Mycobacterium sp. JS623]AGB21686.1 hypothetical protein Mycsm_01269 [Mycobacterium sp. JS623]